MSRLLGVVPGSLALLALAQAISLSYGSGHHFVTYLFWWVLTALLAVAALAYSLWRFRAGKDRDQALSFQDPDDLSDALHKGVAASPLSLDSATAPPSGPSGDLWKRAIANGISELEANQQLLALSASTGHLRRRLGTAARQPLLDLLADRDRHEARQVVDRAYGAGEILWQRLRDPSRRFEGPMAEMVTPTIEAGDELPGVIDAVQRALAALRELQVEPTDAVPRLSFGRAHLPREAQHGSINGFQLPPRRSARIIRVPVTNAQGAADATAVHAELRFMPDDRDGSFSPREPAQGEWIVDGRDAVTRIDLPGNGQVHLLNVAIVFSSGYPCIFEWTRRSREAGLNGYEMWSNGVDVEVSVRGGGPASPSISDTLRIEVLNGMIRADWNGAHADEATNWVAVQGRQWSHR